MDIKEINEITLNKYIKNKNTPKRIISLVPSITELLFDLDLEQEVVGITKFCVHPKLWYKNKPKIGGTKTIHIDRVKALNPDLIIANKEENQQDKIEALCQLFPTYITNVKTMQDGIDMIQTIGKLTHRQIQATQLIQRYHQKYKAWEKLKTQIPPKKVIYLIWRKPYMTIGGDTYISDCLKEGGFINLLAHQTRYPEITIEQMQALQPDMILLSSEPFPFKQKHIDELQQSFPNTTIQLVDGELFSWYGSRMIKTMDYFKTFHFNI